MTLYVFLMLISDFQFPPAAVRDAVGPSTIHPTIERSTLRENVVDEIRMKILNREYEPGMRIVEQNLSDELGVSRGPIREALRQLEQEGLVEYVRTATCS